LITSDDCATYPEVLLNQYGETVVPPRTGKPGRQRAPYKRWPVGSAYATVNKTYAKGTVTAVDRILTFLRPGSLARLIPEDGCCHDRDLSPHPGRHCARTWDMSTTWQHAVNDN